MYEVEMKFRVDDLTGVEAAIARLGGVFGPIEQQADIYFGHPKRDFGQTDEVFRLRSNGDHNQLTYKGPRMDAVTKTRVEVELPLLPGNDYVARLLEMFALLEFRENAVVRKRRREAVVDWEGSQISVALDDVAVFGWFVELEILAEKSEVEHAKQRISSLAVMLKLTNSERRSYCEMIMELQRT